jgi:hypothetical protein
MFRTYAATTEDIDTGRYVASERLLDLLRGEVDLDAIFGDEDADWDESTRIEPGSRLAA